MWTDLPRDSAPADRAKNVSAAGRPTPDATAKALLLNKLFDGASSDQARLDAAEQLFAIYQRASRADLARTLLSRLDGHGLLHGEPPAWLVRRGWALADIWWVPLSGAGIALRRPRAPDAAWLRQCFADPAFGGAVNRSYAARLTKVTDAELERELEHQWRASPLDLGAQLMLIENTARERLGVAAIVNIDADSRRGELVMGLQQPERQGPTVYKAGALMLDFAFRLANLHKLSASIYADNVRGVGLLRMLESLGFKREGLLREHLALSNGQYVDVHLMGGLGDEVLAHPRTIQFFRRTGIGVG